VLANQVAALAVEYGEIRKETILRIISRSSCFPEPKALLEAVIDQMEQHRLVRTEGNRVIRTARARRYLAANLSMIHDERKMYVFDIVSRRSVGTLDESFVVGWIHTGAVFITKGQLWRVLDIEGDRIMVEPAKRAKGELPSWEGEQIPVPYRVAEEVGALRRTRNFGGYAGNGRVYSFVLEFLQRMDASRSLIPTDRLVTIEDAAEGVVCNVCAGTKANEALARVLSVLLSARYGTTVGIEVAPYRVMLRLPPTVKAKDVRDQLMALDPAHIEGVLKLALKRTALFKWKLVQIAKKFGAIDPDADYERISIQRLIEVFDNTVIAAEAYRELLSEYMDAVGAADVVRSIREKKVEVRTGPLTAIGSEGLFSSKDMIPPPSADQAVIGVLKRRLEGDHVLLFCMNCRKWKSKTVVGHVAEHPQCPICEARLIAALKPWEDDLIAIVSKKKKNEEERAVEVRLLKNANIVLSSGRKAVTALAAKGVGPEIASRILATFAEGDAFYREILKAERNFVRTHRFW